MSKARNITEFSDHELAQMVRDSVYTQATTFDENTRFLLVLAVPYGKVDEVETLPEAIDAFQRLLSDYDWPERTFQVYDHEASQHYFGARREDFSNEELEG